MTTEEMQEIEQLLESSRKNAQIARGFAIAAIVCAVLAVVVNFAF